MHLGLPDCRVEVVSPNVVEKFLVTGVSFVSPEGLHYIRICVCVFRLLGLLGLLAYYPVYIAPLLMFVVCLLFILSASRGHVVVARCQEL